MNICFEKSPEAINYAIKTKTFGVFHATEASTVLDMHTHETCEIMVVLRGGKNYLIGDKLYKINDGDLFVVKQSEEHMITFEINAEVEGYTLQIHPEYILSLSTEETDLSECFGALSAKVHLNEEEVALIRRLFAEMDKDYGYGDDIIKRNAVVKLLILAGRAFKERTDIEMKSAVSLPFKRAIFYIDKHYHEKITLEEIANACFISVNQLCRIFKTTLGTTVMKYIIGKRISKAKKLLSFGESVSKTAVLCGFKDYANFIRTFTSSVGVSPGRYSRMNGR